MTYTKMASINREHRIVGMICQGIPYERIARITGLNQKTVNQMGLRNGIRRGAPKPERAASEN